MPFDSNGDYTPPDPPVFPAVDGEVIRADYFNQVIEDIATALSLCIKRNGGSQIIAALDFGGTRITNVAAATEDDDAATLAQVNAVGEAVEALETSTATDIAAALGLRSRGIATISATGSVAGTSARGSILLTADSAAAVALPAASSFAQGERVEFLCTGDGVSTLSRAGSDLIIFNSAAGATSVAMEDGDTLTLMSDGVSTWYAVGGSVQLQVLSTLFPSKTPQDETASRALGTTYTNDLPYPIEIYVTFSYPNAENGTAKVQALLGGDVVYEDRLDDRNGSQGAIHSPTAVPTLVVPPGMTYRFNSVGDYAPVIHLWTEVK